MTGYLALLSPLNQFLTDPKMDHPSSSDAETVGLNFLGWSSLNLNESVGGTTIIKEG